MPTRLISAIRLGLNPDGRYAYYAALLISTLKSSPLGILLHALLAFSAHSWPPAGGEPLAALGCAKALTLLHTRLQLIMPLILLNVGSQPHDG